MTKVKICGITNLEDALHAVECGADALGFNFYRESPRYIAPGASRDIAKKLRKKRIIPFVGVFVNEHPDNILRIAIDTNITVIQLHGDESPGYVEDVHSLTGLAVIKAFRVTQSLTIGAIDEFPIREQEEYFDMAGVLLDSNSPGMYGGTGEVTDWGFAKRVSESHRRVYLAGGLNPENVEAAVRTVRPFAVDVASGVESAMGKKHPKKVETFIRNAKGA